MRKYDLIDVFAIVLITVGVSLFLYGVSISPPSSMQELVRIHFGDWAPGLIIDGVLVIVINRVIYMNERRRTIGQVASLSNEFALDAVRRCRDEGWLESGAMQDGNFDGARLHSADISDARLHGTSFRFADMSGADLTHVDFSNADLTGVNFRNADMRWANLSGACLAWADLQDAHLDGVTFDGANWTHASVNEDLAENHGLSQAKIGGFLTDRQRDLIESSFKSFSQSSEAGAARFYDNLFEMAPGVRPLFPKDVSQQARKFLQSLKVIVGSLSSTDRTTRMLQRLGRRHAGYGAEPAHYPVVGKALVTTLREEVGESFTPEVENAWIAAFELISSAMMSTRIEVGQRATSK